MVNLYTFLVRNRMLFLAITVSLLFAPPPPIVTADVNDCIYENDPRDVDGSIANKAGMIRLRDGDYINAEKCFAESIRRNPAGKHFYNNLAVALMRQGKYIPAYALLKKAISIDPDYSKALSNMAIVCFHLSHFKEAYNYYLLSHRADREYTNQRFEKKRIARKIELLMKSDPENATYKAIYDRLELLDNEKEYFSQDGKTK
jgi:tetratricopeptide (TPR) repeat protein